MKINFRLLLITFGIIVVISVTSTLIFFSLTTTILESKISDTLLKSSYDFVFNFQSLQSRLEDQMISLDFRSDNSELINIDTTEIDFVFPLRNDLQIDRNLMKVSDRTYLNFSSFNLNTFVKNNPNILLQYIQNDDRLIFFGKVINEDLLHDFAERSRIEIVLLSKGNPSEFSNTVFLTQNIASVLNASNNLRNSRNFTVYSENVNLGEFYSTIYNHENLYFNDNRLTFLICFSNNEVYSFRETMGMIMLILIFAGIALSLIFVMLFTTKLRKQISYLSRAAESASKGDFSKKVSIVSNDEIGRLAIIFNQMLAELREKEKREKEYSDFLILLNQNPTLEEIAEETLKMITGELGLSIGAFYLIEENEEKLISLHNIEKEGFTFISDSNYHQKAYSIQKPLELFKEADLKVTTSNLNELAVRYCIIIPIIYHKECIAIIEIAGENDPAINALDYINIIHDQLAVGIINANTFGKLKKYVEELKKLNDEYQKQNERITEKNEQLIRLHTELRLKAGELENEKSKAVELTKVKSQFLASVSHELRTPLNSIIGLTELVLSDMQTNIDTKKRLNVVLKSGQKLLGLINNILDYLKIESGRIELKKESFVLSMFLKEVQQFFEPLIKDKNLEFSIHYKIDSDLLLITDKRKLEQILINLIGNAVKFTNKGSINLTVALLADKELRIAVKDTGMGIKEKNIELIFEEFRQGEGGTKRKYEGTGLGLSITKEYTKLLGGEIYVESTYGKGSEFFLIFREMPFEKIDTYEKLSFTRIRTDKSNIKKKVLVFSESLKTKNLVQDYLLMNKFDVKISRNIEAFNEDIQESYLAVILDVLHSEFEWRLVERIKQNNNGLNIPVVLIGLDEANRTGYGIDIYDFFVGELDDDKYSQIKDSFKTKYDTELNNILIIADIIKADKIIDEECEIHQVISDRYKDEIKEGYDLIILNLEKDTETTLEMVNYLKQERFTKHVPIICRLPEFTDEIEAEWKDLLLKIIKVTKHHPMDILKIIRDRLGRYFDDSGIVQKDDTRDKNDGITEGDSIYNILVVDDDVDTLFTIGEMLNQIGFKYTTAANGVECLMKLNTIQPSVILLDIMMPQMDGFETIKRIKAEEKLAGIPIIALTAYAMLENKEVIEKHKFDDLITKPVSLEDMINKINKHIKKDL